MSAAWIGPVATAAVAPVVRARARPVLETGSLVAAGLALALAVVLASTTPTLLATGAAAVAGGLYLLFAAGFPPRRSDWVRLVVVAGFAWVLNAVFTAGTPAFLWGQRLPVSAAGARVGAETAIRLVALVVLFQGVVRTASPFEVVGGIERALSPLRRLGVRPDGLSVVTMVALRMAPDLTAEARRLAVQRALRGPWPGPDAPRKERERRLRIRLRDLPGVLVPLVLLALRRAEELAWALPARYYGLGPRTPARARAWRARDAIAVAAALAFLSWSAWSRARG